MMQLDTRSDRCPYRAWDGCVFPTHVSIHLLNLIHSDVCCPYRAWYGYAYFDLYLVPGLDISFHPFPYGAWYGNKPSEISVERIDLVRNFHAYIDIRTHWTA